MVVFTRIYVMYASFLPAQTEMSEIWALYVIYYNEFIFIHYYEFI